MHRHRHARLAVTLAVAALLCTAAEAQMQVGDVVSYSLDSARDYDGRSGSDVELVWQHEIFQPDATYLAVHFRDFELAAGDSDIRPRRRSPAPS